MKADNTARRRTFVDMKWEEAEVAASAVIENIDSDATRSARNIFVWKMYLPADCIRTMIALGWDTTT